jgi:S1-C subfamily serine protease
MPAGCRYARVINLVDLAILVAVFIGLANGYQRGFWPSLTQYVGLVAGVIVGAAVAPAVAALLGIQEASYRALAAILVLFIFGSLGSTIGYSGGEAIRRALVKSPWPGPVDRGAGGAFSALAVIAVCWFLGLSLDRVPYPTLASAIQSSAILHRLDGAAPRPPGFLAGVEAVLAGVPFPQTFAGLQPELPSALEVPANVDTAGVRNAEALTVRVSGRGCGGVVTGSGFPVASDYVITNAHVVSGTSSTLIQVQGRGGRALPATVTLFDPNLDVAILHVPGLGLPRMPMSDAARGTQGAVIGYPGGGPETVSPAVVDGSLVARGRDIYEQNLIDRQIFVIESSVHPGNSGGPLVDLDGRALGVVFAASASQRNQAYALTDAQVADDIQRGTSSTGTVNVAAYPCAI